MKSFGMNLLLHAIYNILLGSLEFLRYVKVISSEYLLLAAIVEVSIKNCYVTSRHLTYNYLGGAHVYWFVQFFVDRLSTIEEGIFISVYGYTWKSSCSFTIFHHVFGLLLSYNCD